MKVRSRIVLWLLVSISSSALADPPAPPPDLAEFYQGHRELIGYPPVAPVRGAKHGDSDWIQYVRLRTFKHAKPVSDSEVTQAARKIADTGFNAVISEDSRYLLREADDKIVTGEVDTIGLPFPELVANTRRIVDAFHKEGVHFIGHLTCAQVAPTYAAKHPEQAMIDINTGKPGGDPHYGVAYMCYVNPEFWKLYLQRVTDYIEGTKVDA